MKKRYTIGEVAKFHNLAIGTLRYYDAVGLFCPAEVDADSGYRYFIQIRKIEKGTDDASLPISSY